jgi:hypothetical protein
MRNCSPEEVDALATAVWQILDDMAKHGHCACGAAKADLRIAYEPFAADEDRAYEDWMSLEEALAVRADIERG